MVPTTLSERVERVHGDQGRQWLKELPALVGECRARWSLELERPFENLSYNLLFPGTMSDEWEGTIQLALIIEKLG